MKSCPTPDELTFLLDEQFDDPKHETLVDHLGQCDRCRKLLLDLSVDTADWNAWESMLQTARMSWPCAERPAVHKPSEPRPEIPGYEILEVLGSGGMGIVYQARQQSLNRLVALKMMRSAGDTDPEFQSHFRREAQTLAQLAHPHLVQIYDVLEYQGRPVLALEFVDGGSLADVLHDRTLPPRMAARLVEVLARTMQSVHDAGILHRDLKPANVLLHRAERARLLAPEAGRDGGEPPEPDTVGAESWSRPRHDAKQAPLVKITDFGLARFLEPSPHSTTGELMGTPSYMAPEQARGTPGWSAPAIDVYALGAVLYESLTGRPPFRASSSYETLLQIVRRDPVPASHVVPGLPRELDIITLKCLAKEPAARYASCGELAEDLRRFQSGEPLRARATPAWLRLAKWSKRHPVIAALASSTALALLVLLGVWGRFTHDLRALNMRLKEETSLAERGQRDAELSRAKARQDLFHMGTTLRRYGEIFRNEKELRSPALLPLRQRLLELSLDSYADLLERFDGDEQLVSQRADGYYWLSILNMETGDLELALEQMQQAVLVQESDCRKSPGLGPPDIILATYLHDYAHLLVRLERVPEALDQFHRAIAILGSVPDENTPGHDQVETRAHIDYLLAQCNYQLGHLLWHIGNHDEGGTRMLTAQELIWKTLRAKRSVEGFRLAGTIERRLGKSMHLANEPGMGREAYERAITAERHALDMDPDSAEGWDRMATSLCYLAAWHCREREHASAIEYLEEAGKLRRQLIQEFPHVPEHQWELGAIEATIAKSWYGLGEHAKAARMFEEVIAVQIEQVRQAPDDWSTAYHLVESLIGVAELAAKQEYPSLESLVEEARGLIEPWRDSTEPFVSKTMARLANTAHNEG